MDRRVATEVCAADDVIGALLGLVSGTRLNEVLSTVVSTAAALVRAGDAFLAVLDPDGTVLELIELAGSSRSADSRRLIPDGVARTSRGPVDDGRSDQLAPGLSGMSALQVPSARDGAFTPNFLSPAGRVVMSSLKPICRS